MGIQAASPFEDSSHYHVTFLTRERTCLTRNFRQADGARFPLAQRTARTGLLLLLLLLLLRDTSLVLDADADEMLSLRSRCVLLLLQPRAWKE